MREPQSAGDYDDRTTTAVKSVLIEIGQVLGSFEGKFAIIGGAVPWLLLSEADMPHSGTVDVDLGLDPSALGDGEYVRLIEVLQTHGYDQRGNQHRFQLVRTVPATDDGPDIDVVVDFLMPRDAEIVKNRPPLLSQFAVQRADGAELALKFNQMVYHRRRHARWGKESRSHRRCVDSSPLGHERLRHRQSSETQGRLRHLLFRAKLPRWGRRTSRSNAAAPRRSISPKRLSFYLREVPRFGRLRTNERQKVRGRFPPTRQSHCRSMAAGRLRTG